MPIYGDSGNNLLTGGTAADLIYGGWGNDTIYGQENDDRIFGQENNDLLYGDQGNDELYGGFSADTLYGGEGNDTLYGEGSTVLGGHDWLDGGTGNDLAYGDDGNDTVKGGDGQDTLYGGTGDDLLEGDAGNDWLDGGLGANRLNGGEGNDSYYVYSLKDEITETGKGFDSVYSILDWQLGADLERLVLLGTARTATGNDLSNGLIGNAVANTLTGLAGNDTLNGESGDDVLFGGAGDDLLIGGSGSDTLSGAAGRDRFVFSQPGTDGVDTLMGFDVADDQITIVMTSSSGYAGGDLPLNGPIAASQFAIGAGAANAGDRFIYDSTTGALFFDADGTGGTAQVQIAQLATGLALTHNHIVTVDRLDFQGEQPTEPTQPIVGTAGNDTLTGTRQGDVMQGLAGNDQLSGLGGRDSLIGGAGADTLFGGGGNDWLNGGAGSDDYRGGTGSDVFAIARGAGRDRILDFQDGQDVMRLMGDLTYEALTIRQQGNHTLIQANGDLLAVLTGIQASQITAADFISI